MKNKKLILGCGFALAGSLLVNIAMASGLVTIENITDHSIRVTDCSKNNYIIDGDKTSDVGYWYSCPQGLKITTDINDSKGKQKKIHVNDENTTCSWYRDFGYGWDADLSSNGKSSSVACLTKNFGGDPNAHGVVTVTSTKVILAPQAGKTVSITY